MKKYLCIKDVIMDGSGVVTYIKGRIYPSEYEGCVTNEQGDTHHMWSDKSLFNEYFIPEKWAVRGCKELGEIIGDEENVTGRYKNWLYFQDKFGKWDGFHNEGYHDYTTITLEQFKKAFMQKEIIGYKCPTDLFNGKVIKGTVYLIDENHSSKEYNSCSYEGGKPPTNMPKEVVETWEPVYKFEEQTFKVGNFKIVVKDGKAYHKSEDISSFISAMYNHYSLAEAFGHNNYTAYVKEVTFSTTGCEKGESKLSEWMEVYKQMAK